MKRIIFLFLLFTSSALSQPLCTVSGTISNYNLSGYSIRTGLIKELRRSGVIVPYRDAPITVSTTGQVRFQVPQTVGTDTTKIRIYLPAPGWTGVGDQGVWVAIPHGATATLNSLVSVPYVAPAYPIVTPVQLFFDSTGNTIFYSDTLWLGSGLAAVPKGNGSNDYAIINTSTGTSTDTSSLSYRIDEAKDIANGKADADSMKLAFDRLGDRADADSVILKADTTSLHAQKFAVLTDQVAGKADGDSVSTALQSKVSISDSTTRYATPTQVYTTVNDSLETVVRSEVDPTATAKAQAAVKDSLDACSTNGTRGLSSTKRIFAQMDSITFIGEAGDVIDLSLGNNFRGTISANDTLSFSNAVDGQVIQVVITNAGTHTLSWTGVSWPGGTQPVLTAVANKRSIYSFIVSGGMIHGVAALNY